MRSRNFFPIFALQNFSVTQILRQIKVSESRDSKSTIKELWILIFINFCTFRRLKFTKWQRCFVKSTLLVTALVKSCFHVIFAKNVTANFYIFHKGQCHKLTSRKIWETENFVSLCTKKNRKTWNINHRRKKKKGFSFESIFFLVEKRNKRKRGTLITRILKKIVNYLTNVLSKMSKIDFTIHINRR